MNALNFEQLSEKEMKQIHGGRWVKVNGQWYWVEDYVLDGYEETGNS